MHKTILNTALATVLGFAAFGVQAAVLNIGDQLTINAGQTSSSIFVNGSGSYFALDGNGNLKIATTEKVAIGQGTTGIVIGATTVAGASHAGEPTAGDTNAIDAPWTFFGNTGSDYTTVGITGSTTAGLDMSGWTWTWAGIPAISLGTGAWQTATGTGHTGATGTFADGIGNFTWSGVYGTAYSLDYRAQIPIGDPSGLGGCWVEWHYEGIVNAVPQVPVPAAAWLFGSGIVALAGIGRRKPGRGK